MAATWPSTESKHQKIHIYIYIDIQNMKGRDDHVRAAFFPPCVTLMAMATSIGIRCHTIFEVTLCRRLLLA